MKMTSQQLGFSCATAVVLATAPRRSCFSPKAAASLTAGWSYSTDSTSAHEMFSPAEATEDT